MSWCSRIMKHINYQIIKILQRKLYAHKNIPENMFVASIKMLIRRPGILWSLWTLINCWDLEQKRIFIDKHLENSLAETLSAIPLYDCTHSRMFDLIKWITFA